MSAGDSSVTLISSRDNPLLKELRRLGQEPTAYRKLGRIWVEGEHLCQAASQRGLRAAVAVFSESFPDVARVQWSNDAIKKVAVSEPLWRSLSSLESPPPMGCVFELPVAATLATEMPTVVLDRLQDAGNVGAILRSAAAFGFTQIIALKGTAALWAPKVLRAGMGAHFGLRLIEGADAESLDALKLPLLATSSHAGDYLHEAQSRQSLPHPCAWLFGHEGQGLSDRLLQRATGRVRIAQPGGEESLNVAAAAAICLHASAAVAWVAQPRPRH